MIRFFYVLLLLLAPLSFFGQNIQIVPKPTTVEFENGNFEIKDRLSYEIYGIQADSVEIGINQLTDEFKTDFNTSLQRRISPELLIGIPERDELFNQSEKKSDSG